MNPYYLSVHILKHVLCIHLNFAADMRCLSLETGSRSLSSKDVKLGLWSSGVLRYSAVDRALKLGILLQSRVPFAMSVCCRLHPIGKEQIMRTFHLQHVFSGMKMNMMDLPRLSFAAELRLPNSWSERDWHSAGQQKVKAKLKSKA